MTATVFIGIGSNLGDRVACLEKAVEFLRAHEEIKVLSVSQWRESEPAGGPPQGNYLNGVLHIQTSLMPLDLLTQLKIIERRLGRAKSAEINAPRPIDLDILFYDDVVIFEGKNLTIPHPRLAQRRFVLEPLCEIAPDLKHPRLGKTVRELLQNLENETHSQSRLA